MHTATLSGGVGAPWKECSAAPRRDADGQRLHNGTRALAAKVVVVTARPARFPAFCFGGSLTLRPRLRDPAQAWA